MSFIPILKIYDKLSRTSGPISEIIEQAAKDIADGQPAETVKRRAYAQIRAVLEKDLPALIGQPRTSGAPREGTGASETGGSVPPAAGRGLFSGGGVSAEQQQPVPDPELEEQVQQEVPLHPITERERKKDYPPLPWEETDRGEPVEPTEEDLAELAEMWDWNAFAALEILQYVQNLEEYEQWKREVTEERQRLLRLRRKEVIEEQRRKALAAKKQYEQLN